MAHYPTLDMMALFTANNALSSEDQDEARQMGEATKPLALKLFETIPAWAIVHAALDNRNAPLIRSGEIVVAESDGCGGWLPTNGGLFLIEYVSTPRAEYEPLRRRLEIVQTFEGKHGWYAGSIRRGAVGATMYCADGPYSDANALAAKLIGRVVGIVATAPVTGRNGR